MTDTCPNCCRRRIPPCAERRRGNGLVHGYRCPGCGHEWVTARYLPAYSDIHRRRAERQTREAA
ncbi:MULTISPECIES: hypothetical protein [Streptomyces]|uniref:hypothetical protein n=1 Tax=Streptomyces TaxID=1883 RepID=UPI0004CD9BB4|nr:MULTISPECIES: hypothetical protein [Streptomyces]KOT49942.1 hypothetical protein ADK43_35080 [Streptomyces rimosus subsp. rimosus]